jgi:hypothetical protein
MSPLLLKQRRNPLVTYRLAVISIASLAMFAAPVPAETPPIEKIAPENSVLVFGSANATQAFESLKRTPLWAMWQSDKMKTMRADAMKKMDEGLKQMLQDLGVEEDSLKPPTGSVGIALFTVPDPELATPQLSVMALGDWGESADKMDALVKAALDKGVKEDKLEFEEKDVGGHNVYVIDLAKMQPPAGEGDEGDGGMGMGGMPMPDLAELLKGMTKMHYVRDGNTLMLCSDMTSLTDALDAVDGKADAGGAGKFAQREDFQNTVAQMGKETDAYGVLLTRDIMDLVGAQNPMMMMVRPILRSLVGEVGGYGLGVRFDAEGAMSTQTLGVYMPNGKKALTELMDRPTPRGDVPGFVPAETVSYMTANFEFSGLMDVIKGVVAANPMLAMQAGEVMPEIEKNLGPIFAALGSKIHRASVVSGDKSSDVVALQCRDVQAFENAFGGLAGEGGLEARDFLGQRIYTVDPEMMPMLPMGGGAGESVSIGIGGGNVYLGDTPGVEQALRATGQADASGLAKDATFQRAANFLGHDPVVAWGYTDTVASAEAMIKQQQAQHKAMIEDMKQWDPETAAEMEKELAASPDPLKDLDPAFLRQYIGPTTWKATSNDKGFVFNIYMLPASN